jgi:hypothetical protein
MNTHLRNHTDTLFAGCIDLSQFVKVEHKVTPTTCSEKIDEPVCAATLITSRCISGSTKKDHRIQRIVVVDPRIRIPHHVQVREAKAQNAADLWAIVQREVQP